MKKYFYLILVCSFMLMIFNFSLQPAILSNANSTAFTQILVPQDYPNRDQAIATLNNLIRDAAHIFEYFLLSIPLILLLLRTQSHLNHWFVFIIGLPVLFLIALIDENIQIPVVGRAFEWIDIAKDVTGYLLACLSIQLLSILRRTKDHLLHPKK